jgi:hypothetical protein
MSSIDLSDHTVEDVAGRLSPMGRFARMVTPTR